jgi:hypothetical protein
MRWEGCVETDENENKDDENEDALCSGDAIM